MQRNILKLDEMVATLCTYFCHDKRADLSDAAQSVAGDCGFGFMTGVRTMGKLSSSQLA